MIVFSMRVDNISGSIRKKANIDETSSESKESRDSFHVSINRGDFLVREHVDYGSRRGSPRGIAYPV